MRELQDKVAVVTGAGSGIGRATATALARKGCELAICDVDQASLDDTRKLIEEIGRPVSTHIVNVAKESEMRDFAAEVIRQHKEVHILVNNAGVTVVASFEDHSVEDIDWIFGVNLWGVMYGCKFFLPHLKQQKQGHIVNLSSVFGIIAPPMQTTYVATKFAVRGFSESLRGELASHNIGVTSVHPGTIQTNIVKSARVNSDIREEFREATQRNYDKWGTSPDVVGQRIVRAIELNSPRVLVTRESHVADALKRLMPATTDGLVARVSKRMRTRR